MWYSSIPDGIRLLGDRTSPFSTREWTESKSLMLKGIYFGREKFTILRVQLSTMLKNWKQNNKTEYIYSVEQKGKKNTGRSRRNKKKMGNKYFIILSARFLHLPSVGNNSVQPTYSVKNIVVYCPTFFSIPQHVCTSKNPITKAYCVWLLFLSVSFL